MVIFHSYVSLPEGNYHSEYHYHYHYHCQKLLLTVMIDVDELLSSQHTLSKYVKHDSPSSFCPASPWRRWMTLVTSRVRALRSEQIAQGHDLGI